MSQPRRSARRIAETIKLLEKNFQCAICIFHNTGIVLGIRRDLYPSPCLELMKTPVQTKCGHIFCRHCLHLTIGNKRDAPCPLCKAPFTKRSLQTLTNWNCITQTVANLIQSYDADIAEIACAADDTESPSTRKTSHSKVRRHSELDRDINGRQTGDSSKVESRSNVQINEPVSSKDRMDQRVLRDSKASNTNTVEESNHAKTASEHCKDQKGKTTRSKQLKQATEIRNRQLLEHIEKGPLKMGDTLSANEPPKHDSRPVPSVSTNQGGGTLAAQTSTMKVQYNTRRSRQRSRQTMDYNEPADSEVIFIPEDPLADVELTNYGKLQQETHCKSDRSKAIEEIENPKNLSRKKKDNNNGKCSESEVWQKNMSLVQNYDLQSQVHEKIQKWFNEQKTPASIDLTASQNCSDILDEGICPKAFQEDPLVEPIFPAATDNNELNYVENALENIHEDTKFEDEKLTKETHGTSVVRKTRSMNVNPKKNPTTINTGIVTKGRRKFKIKAKAREQDTGFSIETVTKPGNHPPEPVLFDLSQRNLLQTTQAGPPVQSDNDVRFIRKESSKFEKSMVKPVTRTYGGHITPSKLRKSAEDASFALARAPPKRGPKIFLCRGEKMPVQHKIDTGLIEEMNPEDPYAFKGSQNSPVQKDRHGKSKRKGKNSLQMVPVPKSKQLKEDKLEETSGEKISEEGLSNSQAEIKSIQEMLSVAEDHELLFSQQVRDMEEQARMEQGDNNNEISSALTPNIETHLQEDVIENPTIMGEIEQQSGNGEVIFLEPPQPKARADLSVEVESHKSVVENYRQKGEEAEVYEVPNEETVPEEPTKVTRKSLRKRSQKHLVQEEPLKRGIQSRGQTKPNWGGLKEMVRDLVPQSKQLNIQKISPMKVKGKLKRRKRHQKNTDEVVDVTPEEPIICDVETVNSEEAASHKVPQKENEDKSDPDVMEIHVQSDVEQPVPEHVSPVSMVIGKESDDTPTETEIPDVDNGEQHNVDIVYLSDTEATIKESKEREEHVSNNEGGLLDEEEYLSNTDSKKKSERTNVNNSSDITEIRDIQEKQSQPISKVHSESQDNGQTQPFSRFHSNETSGFEQNPSQSLSGILRTQRRSFRLTGSSVVSSNEGINQSPRISEAGEELLKAVALALGSDSTEDDVDNDDLASKAECGEQLEEEILEPEPSTDIHNENAAESSPPGEDATIRNSDNVEQKSPLKMQEDLESVVEVQSSVSERDKKTAIKEQEMSHTQLKALETECEVQGELETSQEAISLDDLAEMVIPDSVQEGDKRTSFLEPASVDDNDHTLEQIPETVEETVTEQAKANEAEQTQNEVFESIQSCESSQSESLLKRPAVQITSHHLEMAENETEAIDSEMVDIVPGSAPSESLKKDRGRPRRACRGYSSKESSPEHKNVKKESETQNDETRKTTPNPGRRTVRGIASRATPQMKLEMANFFSDYKSNSPLRPKVLPASAQPSSEKVDSPNTLNSQSSKLIIPDTPDVQPQWHQNEVKGDKSGLKKLPLFKVAETPAAKQSQKRGFQYETPKPGSSLLPNQTVVAETPAILRSFSSPVLQKTSLTSVSQDISQDTQSGDSDNILSPTLENKSKTKKAGMAKQKEDISANDTLDCNSEKRENINNDNDSDISFDVDKVKEESPPLPMSYVDEEGRRVVRALTTSFDHPIEVEDRPTTQKEEMEAVMENIDEDLTIYEDMEKDTIVVHDDTEEDDLYLPSLEAIGQKSTSITLDELNEQSDTDKEDEVIKPRRKSQINVIEDDISDDDDNIEVDNSATNRNLDLTSSSAFSSLSDIQGTEQKEDLEEDCEKIQEAIAQLEAELAEKALGNEEETQESEDGDEDGLTNLSPKSLALSGKSVKAIPDSLPGSQSEYAQREEQSDVLSEKTMISQSQKASQSRDMPPGSPPPPTPPSKEELKAIRRQKQGSQNKDENPHSFLDKYRTNSPSVNDGSERAKRKRKLDMNVSERPEKVAKIVTKVETDENLGVASLAPPTAENPTAHRSPLQRKTSPNVSTSSSFASNEIEFPARPHWCFVTSGVKKMRIRTRIKTFEKLVGARSSSSITQGVTHLIMSPADPDDDLLVCERTLKYFQAIAAQKWVVSSQWVSDSLSKGQLLPEDDYEIHGDSTVDSPHFGPRRSRLKGGTLFHQYEVHCMGDFLDITKEELRSMIEMCGGSTVQDPLLFSFEPQQRQIIIVEPGSSLDLNLLRRLYQKYGVHILSKEWVLDCVGQYRLQRLTDYIINLTTDSQVPY